MSAPRRSQPELKLAHSWLATRIALRWGSLTGETPRAIRETESRKAIPEKQTNSWLGQVFDAHPAKSIPTKKLELSALRAFLNALVNSHVLALNPAATSNTPIRPNLDLGPNGWPL